MIPDFLVRRDHPRVCGEKPKNKRTQMAGQGSPPRMRGKVNELRSGVCPNGITPAYAGKSDYVLCDCSNSWDHPRVCGEKLGGGKYEISGEGITPAYAGKRVCKSLRSP